MQIFLNMLDEMKHLGLKFGDVEKDFKTTNEEHDEKKRAKKRIEKKKTLEAEANG